MVSRIKKLKKRIVENLGERIVPNGRPGRLLKNKYPKPNRKARRHSGRQFPQSKYPPEVLAENDIFLDYYWNDWRDYRDGQRDLSRRRHGYSSKDDRLELYQQADKKLTKQNKIRKARRERKFCSKDI